MLEKSVSGAAAPAAAPDSTIARENWYACSMLALERLPVPYPVLVIGIGLYTAGEQILEHVTAPLAYRYPPNEVLGQAAVIVILMMYILIYLGVLKRRAVIGLTKLRPAVEISDQEYVRYTRSMLNANPRFEVALFAVSVVVNYLLFIVARVDPQMRTDGGMPHSVFLSIIFMSVYVLLGWLLLSLVYTSIRFARGLSMLARKPLEVNVFDPGNLVPFGELSLLHSLAAVGSAAHSTSPAGYATTCRVHFDWAGILQFGGALHTAAGRPQANGRRQRAGPGSDLCATDGWAPQADGMQRMRRGE